jgi:hypothetical protein
LRCELTIRKRALIKHIILRVSDSSGYHSIFNSRCLWRLAVRIIVVEDIVVRSHHHVAVVVYKLVLRLTTSLQLSLSPTAFYSTCHLSSPQIARYPIVTSHVHYVYVPTCIRLRYGLVVIALSDLLRLYVHICDVHHIQLLLTV